MAVLALLSALLVPLGSPPTSARAAEPETAVYESQVNAFSTLYLVDGVVFRLATASGTTVIDRWRAGAWQRVGEGAFGDARPSLGALALAGAVVKPDGTLYRASGMTSVSRWGRVEKGIYLTWDGLSQTIHPERPGVAGRQSLDGRHYVWRDGLSLKVHDLIEQVTNTLVDTLPSGAAILPSVGHAGKVWYADFTGATPAVCSVALVGGEPECGLAAAVKECLAGHNPAWIESSRGPICTSGTGWNRFAMALPDSPKVVTATLPADGVVTRVSGGDGAELSMVVASNTGRATLIRVDPLTASHTTVLTTDAWVPADIGGFAVDRGEIVVSYRLPPLASSWAAVWRRRLGETSSAAGSFVADVPMGADTMLAAHGRLYVSAGHLAGSRFAGSTLVYDGTNGPIVREGRVEAVSGPYWYRSGEDAELRPTLFREGSSGPVAAEVYTHEGSVVNIDARQADGSYRLVLRDLEGRMPDRTVSMGPLSALAGDWAYLSSSSAFAGNVRTGTFFPVTGGLPKLGDGFLVQYDGTVVDLRTNARSRWLPEGQDAGSRSFGIIGSSVVWWDQYARQMRSRDTKIGPTIGPRLLGTVGGDLDLAVPGADWALDLYASKAVGTGKLQVYSGSTLVAELATAADVNGGVRGVPRWSGTDVSGSPVHSGTYRWVYQAAAADGTGAVTLPGGTAVASGTFVVRNSPSDTPLWSYVNQLARDVRERLSAHTSDESCTLPLAGCKAAFAGGEVYWSSRTGGGVVPSPMVARYAALGGAGGALGYPVGSGACGLAGQSCRADFQFGSMYWSAGTGVRVVRGAIQAHYLRIGADRSRIGLPVTDEVCGLVRSGCYQTFQYGQMHWSPSTGAHFSLGHIRNKWGSLGWERGRLGYPVTDEVCGLRQGGCYQRYEGGHVHWSPSTAAHATWGGIGSRWGAMSWERGALGYPTTDEQCGLVRSGCFQRFQGGMVHWSPATGAHATRGGMVNGWGKANWERGPLGYPITEMVCGIRDGGCYQRFEGGIVYWRDTRDNYGVPIWGKILEKYASMGYERSWLAYPAAPQSTFSTHISQTFNRGMIYYDPRTGRFWTTF